ncbi:hypothetical protein [Pseudoalteromonas sp.]|nr:hypothetical protein [Pseudoalteromonas sp.]
MKEQLSAVSYQQKIKPSTVLGLKIKGGGLGLIRVADVWTPPH